MFHPINKRVIGKRNNPLKNIEVVDKICSIMDKLNPKSFSHKNLITFVKDRPGHDERYAIDTSFIEEKMGMSEPAIFLLIPVKTKLSFS